MIEMKSMTTMTLFDWEQRKPNNFLTESKIIGHKGNQAKKLTVKLWGKGIQEKQNTYSGFLLRRWLYRNKL